MKRNLLLLSIASLAISCQKNEQSDQLPVQEKIDGIYSNNPPPNQVCDKIYISNANQSLTIKDQTYYYPTSLINLTGLPTDSYGNRIVLANCIDNSSATAAQQLFHRRNDSLINMAQDAFRKLALGQPKQPPLAPYTMQELEFAMDNTPWADGSDGASYVSLIFNNTIRKNPEIPKLPGISTVLLLPALIQNKNFDEITLTQAINYTNHAEGFVIAVGLYSSDQLYATIIDSRYYRHLCECEPIEKIIGRQGPGPDAKVRLSSFFDYNTASSIRYFYFARN